MKYLILLFFTATLFSCSNSGNDKKTSEEAKPAAENNSPVAEATPPPATNTSSSGVVYSADGTEIKNSASILVTKDKDKLKAGIPYICMLTSNAAANDNEYLTINFLLDTKTGTYPVVGSSFLRGKGDNSQTFGGLLGGKPKLTDKSVTITECKDLGDNGQGGHKWSISGYWEDLTIKAMPIMLMDKTKKHPEEVKLGKGTFTNLVFDDNWDEMMEKAMKKMDKKKN